MTELQGEGWPERFTAGVAGQIKRYRESKGQSYQQLADACTALGYPTLRTTLANLENGRRKSVTVHELVVIAEALAVPPIQLLFPGLPQGPVEYLPGRTSIAWQALQWFNGEWNPGDDERGAALNLMRELEAIPDRVAEAHADAARYQRDLYEEEQELADAQSKVRSTPDPVTEIGREGREMLMRGHEDSVEHARRMLARANDRLAELRNYDALLKKALSVSGFTIKPKGDDDV